jgi:hypothetical protein
MASTRYKNYLGKGFAGNAARTAVHANPLAVALRHGARAGVAGAKALGFGKKKPDLLHMGGLNTVTRLADKAVKAADKSAHKSIGGTFGHKSVAGKVLGTLTGSSKSKKGGGGGGGLRGKQHRRADGKFG